MCIIGYYNVISCFYACFLHEKYVPPSICLLEREIVFLELLY